MALNPLSPQEYEVAFNQWATGLAAVANQAEALAEFSETMLTEANRLNGSLVQGYSGQTAIPWTAEQLASAQAMGLLARGFTNWVRTATGNPARSPLQRLQAVVRILTR